MATNFEHCWTVALVIPIKLIGAKCKSVGVRQIVMLTGVTIRKMQVYDAHVESLNKDSVLDISLTKIEQTRVASTRKSSVQENPENVPSSRRCLHGRL